MNICITGGLGYIGRHVVDALCRQGHKVLVIDKDSHGSLTPFLAEKYPNVNIHIDDLYDIGLLDILKDNKIETVIHLASSTSVRQVDNPLVTILGLGNYVAKTAKVAGVKTFINASSAAAAVNNCFELTSNKLGYGGAKLKLEEILNKYNWTGGSFNCFNLRIHNPYGHSNCLPFSDHKESLWFNLVKAVETGDMLELTSRTKNEHGTVTRDWINIFDVANVIIAFATMDHSNLVNKPYWDVGSGIGQSAYLFTKSFITVEDISITYKFVGANPNDLETSVSSPIATYEYINYRSKVGHKVYSNSYLNGVYMT